MFTSDYLSTGLSSTTREAARRRRLLTRALPVVLLGVAAFVAGAIVAANRTELAAVQRFADDWERPGLRGHVRRALPGRCQRRYPLSEFTDAYDRAQQTATVTTSRPARSRSRPPAGSGGRRCRSASTPTPSGRSPGSLELPLDGDRVAWSPNLVSRVSPRDERLVRRTRIPERAPILARDGTPSPRARRPPAPRRSGAAAQNAVGEISSPSAQQNQELVELGFRPAPRPEPAGWSWRSTAAWPGSPVGSSSPPRRGCRAQATGSALIATSQPVPGKPVHTTIDPDLAARRGGGARQPVRRGRRARCQRRLGAGAGRDRLLGPQPPGSTFKLITTTAALDAGVVSSTDQFPIQTSTVGRRAARSPMPTTKPAAEPSSRRSPSPATASSSCSGRSSARTAWSATAERYGFNSPPSLFDDRALEAMDPPQSTIPPRSQRPRARA